MRGLWCGVWEYVLSPLAILRILPPGIGGHSSHAKATANETAPDALTPGQWLTSKAKATVISRAGFVRKGGYVCMVG